MSSENLSTKARKPRADAQRNRDHIVQVAREAFAEEGDGVTFEEIVKRSGLGTGTLYRHFSTREALVEAVYLSEIQRLASAASSPASDSPLEALRQWMLLFIDLLSTKQIMRESLSAMVSASPEVYKVSGDLITRSIDGLVSRAVESGEAVPDVEPLDLLRALTGVSNASAGPNWQASARRMVDVLIAGIRV